MGGMKYPKYQVEDRGFSTPCWTWLVGIDRDGYGTIVVEKTRRRAHREFYEQRYGRIPEGKQIDHLCRNRACVNPEHLEAVTGLVNQRRGNGTTLQPEDIVAIRNRHNQGELGRDLARAFGVSESRVSNILTGQNTGADVGGPTRKPRNQPLLPLEQRIEVWERAQAGERNADIAADYGISESWVGKMKCRPKPSRG